MSFRYISRASNALDRLRGSPAAIATTAGLCGLLGGALMVSVLARPSPEQVVSRVPVETTGSATPERVVPRTERAKFEPAKTEPVKIETAKQDPATPEPHSSAVSPADQSSALDCDQQTWPHITPQCLAENDTGQRKLRVISTDRLAAPVVSAIETPASRPKREAREQQAAVPAAVVGSAPPPLPTASSLTPTPSGPTAAPAAELKLQQALPVEQKSKSARDKRKREAKRRAPARDDDDADAIRPDTRTGGRIVERWTEREYDVPSYDGSQRRRVIVRSGDAAYLPPPRSYSRY